MLQLQKRIQNNNIYYLVVDLKAGSFKDMLYICPENSFPLLENYVYQIMDDTLNFSFKNTDYNPQVYKTNLFLLHRLEIINSNVLMETVKPLSNIYIELKYGILEKVIYIMNHKSTIEGVNNLKNAVLKTDFIKELSPNLRSELGQANKLISPKSDMHRLYNEIIKLIINQTANSRIDILAQKQNTTI